MDTSGMFLESLVLRQHPELMRDRAEAQNSQWWLEATGFFYSVLHACSILGAFLDTWMFSVTPLLQIWTWHLDIGVIYGTSIPPSQLSHPMLPSTLHLGI